MKRVVISAPFGNYLGEGWATRTLGTFTLHKRPGRWKQVLKTVRYNPIANSWRNKIGLRNPGIGWLVDQWHKNDINNYATEVGHLYDQKSAGIDVSDKIISIHGFNLREWDELIYCTPDLNPEMIELNISCPNVEDVGQDIPEIMKMVQDSGHADKFIVKLPPHPQTTPKLAIMALNHGIKWVHLCNTLPGKKGGISGSPLRPISRGITTATKACLPDLSIIGGGGISCYDHMVEYIEAGADHVSIASALFFPWNWLRLKWAAKKLKHHE